MQFPTTHWSQLVLESAAGQTAAQAALEGFCARYRQPVLEFVRWNGFPVQDAEELTQEFFVRLIRSGSLGRVERSRGRFRSFLMAAIRHHLVDARRREGALRRGGQSLHIPLDEEIAEDSGQPDAEATDRASAVFDRHWATQMVANALDGVAAEFAEDGRAHLFPELAPFLAVGAEPPSYEDLAGRLGVTVAGLKTDVHRLRKRFRLMIRREVGRTVSAPHEIDAEMTYLHQILAHPGFS